MGQREDAVPRARGVPGLKARKSLGQHWLTDPELSAWMEKEDKVHKELMDKGGLLKK